MDLKIPNIVKPIALKDYTEGGDFPPEFEQIIIWVWVNPRKELRLAFINDIATGKATEVQIGAWFSEIWSQGIEDTHFTPEEVIALAKSCLENEPQLWWWLVNQTSQLITDHYLKKKVTSITPPSN